MYDKQHPNNMIKNNRQYIYIYRERERDVYPIPLRGYPPPCPFPWGLFCKVGSGVQRKSMKVLSKNCGKSGTDLQKSWKIRPWTPPGEAWSTRVEKKMKKGVRGHTCGRLFFAHVRPWIHFFWLRGDFLQFFRGPGSGLVFFVGFGWYLRKKYTIQGFDNTGLDCAGVYGSHMDHFGQLSPSGPHFGSTLAPFGG